MGENTKDTEFVWRHHGQRVQVAGSYSEWQPRDMTRGSDGFWRISLPVSVDTDHEFKFVVDGDNWLHDQDQPARTNEMGSFNNFIRVNGIKTEPPESPEKVEVKMEPQSPPPVVVKSEPIDPDDLNDEPPQMPIRRTPSPVDIKQEPEDDDEELEKTFEKIQIKSEPLDQDDDIEPPQMEVRAPPPTAVVNEAVNDSTGPSSSTLVEVERKFSVPENFRELLPKEGFHPLPGLEEERLVDEYFDTSDSFELMKNDFWLRKRNGDWELKYPLVQSPKSSPRKKDNLKPETSLYHETSNIEEILLKLKSLGVLEDSVITSPDKGGDDSIDRLVKGDILSSYAKLETTRLHFKRAAEEELREVNVVVDYADWGFRVGEIEIMVADQLQVSEAVKEIEGIAKKLDLETVLHGKIESYLRNHRQDAYEIYKHLQAAKGKPIIKREPLENYEKDEENKGQLHNEGVQTTDKSQNIQPSVDLDQTAGSSNLNETSEMSVPVGEVSKDSSIHETSPSLTLDKSKADKKSYCAIL